ncbi:unnamed protein product [Psylliodes chrysocephalus]|uniref:Uncharacterized protein n=1 Tax=Psylliodes chrysocephalus TaxID=3402493 RepID=A0A9P0D340_9CUCU|nr:unnamed protein product [Psylliodes chrysocephala]
MVEIRKLRLAVEDCFEPSQEPTLFDADLFDRTEEDYEFMPALEDFEEEEDDDDTDNFMKNIISLRKIQDALDHIEFTLSEFMIKKRFTFMDRNIFSLNNRGMRDQHQEDPLLEDPDLPENLRRAAFIMSQGDNRQLEDLIRTVNQNIVVNVNMSFYFKIMILMLTANTVLLFKWIIWDQISELFC